MYLLRRHGGGPEFENIIAKYCEGRYFHADRFSRLHENLHFRVD